MSDDVTDTWLGRAIRDACATAARDHANEQPDTDDEETDR